MITAFRLSNSEINSMPFVQRRAARPTQLVASAEVVRMTILDRYESDCRFYSRRNNGRKPRTHRDYR